MAGRLKSLIDLIIEQRARGEPLLMETTKAKLIFKGINPAAFTSMSPDDPRIEEKIRAAAAELGVLI
ncbi:MAG TPA: hypothetical protein VLW84_12100 [Terriglobales bacterium]|nr:hypothetical protein [Terriglobales bacterium]